MNKLAFLLLVIFANISWAITTNVQCVDNASGKAISFDFRTGRANIYVCEKSDSTCDSANVQPNQQAVIVSNSPGEYAPITYQVTAGNEPLAPGSTFVLQFHEDQSQVEIKAEGDESRFTCSTGLSGN